VRTITLAAAVTGALMLPLAPSAKLVEVDTTCGEFLRLDPRDQMAKAEAIRIAVQDERASGAGGDDTSRPANSDQELAEKIHDACIGTPKLQVSPILRNLMGR
jgi:hypothetical protein